MNLLKTKSKLIITIFGIISALLLILALVFMTQYAHVHVVYTLNNAGEVEIAYNSTMSVGSYELTNQYLFNYLESTTKVSPVTQNFEEGSKIIYDFQQSMNGFNNFIIATFVVCIVMFALLLVFANYSRRVYYKSNLIVGIAAPGVAIAFCLAAFIWCVVLLNRFNNNIDLFRITAVMEDYSIGAKVKRSNLSFEEFVSTYASNVNSLTFVLTMIYYLVVICSASFVIVNAIMKYFATEGRRKEIIERAKLGVQYGK